MGQPAHWLGASGAKTDDMSRDLREKESEFIAGLAADTGRDLGQWMALIDGQTFAHRNDMIDWLRQQGLTFAKASRLERIHHNGGKPLYGERPIIRIAPEPPAAPAAPAKPEIAPPPADVAVEPARPTPLPATPVAAPPPAATAKPPTPPPPILADLSSFLAKAKGYRPLAELLLRAVREAVPGATVHLQETHADLAAPLVFGALAVTAKDVRLALDLGDRPFEGDLKRLRLPGTAANLTHTIVISDARRVDADLKALVAAAAARANS